MKHKLWFIVGFIALPSTFAASFDCSKAKTKDEIAICQSHDLSEADSKLDKVFKVVRAQYDVVRQKSLIEGQRKWLKLRSVACSAKEYPSNGYDFQVCLQRVYEERLQELQDELVIQQEDKKEGINSTADLEKILDKKLKTSFNQGMRPNGDYGEPEEIEPTTCREFYTFDAGIWKFGGDSIGGNAYMYALNSCAFEILSARTYPSATAKSNEIDFGDITQYSTEIACIVGNCNGTDDEDADDEGVHTFKEEAARKKISIVRQMSGVIPDNTLAIGKNEFQIGGMHYSYALSPVADYTYKGRKEVLMSIGYYAVGGSMHGSILVIAYFDPATKSIRPVTISGRSRLRPLID